MYVFKSNAKYSNGKSVNEVIEVLQEKYGFLNKFDIYVGERILEYPFDSIDNKEQLSIILTKLFKEYLENHIAHSKLSFMDTLLLYNTTKVIYTSI